jgi:hypothetical protein
MLTRGERGVWSAASIAALSFYFRERRPLPKQNAKAAILAALQMRPAL